MNTIIQMMQNMYILIHLTFHSEVTLEVTKASTISNWLRLNNIEKGVWYKLQVEHKSLEQILKQKSTQNYQSRKLENFHQAIAP